MAKKERGQIVETATEARQAEPGPSVLALLIISTGLAIVILGVVWFVFFRTLQLYEAQMAKLNSAISRSTLDRSILRLTGCCVSCWNWTAKWCDASIRILAFCTAAPRN